MSATCVLCSPLITGLAIGGEELCHHFASCRVDDDDVDVDYDYIQYHHDHNHHESQLSWLEFNLFGWKECKSPPLTNNMINGTSTISTKNANRLQQHVLTAMIKAADLGNPEKVKAIIHLVIVMFTHTLNTLHRHWVRKPKNPIDHHHLQMLTVIFAECDQKSWQERAYQIATSMLINHALVLFFIFPTPFPSSPPCPKTTRWKKLAPLQPVRSRRLGPSSPAALLKLIEFGSAVHKSINTINAFNDNAQTTKHLRRTFVRRFSYSKAASW